MVENRLLAIKFSFFVFFIQFFQLFLIFIKISIKIPKTTKNPYFPIHWPKFRSKAIFDFPPFSPIHTNNDISLNKPTNHIKNH